MKNLLFLLSILSLFVFTGCGIDTGSTMNETRKGLSLNENSNIINCNLSLENTIVSEPDNNGNYNEIKSDLYKSENPLTLTFVGVNTETPVMRGNMDTVQLTKIDNGDTIYLFETTAIGNIAIYTYFPKEKIMIMSKQYNLVGNLFGSQMMGFCE